MSAPIKKRLNIRARPKDLSSVASNHSDNSTNNSNNSNNNSSSCRITDKKKFVIKKTLKVVDNLVVKYHYDYDITLVHSMICQKLEEETIIKPGNYQKEFDEYLSLATKRQSYGDRQKTVRYLQYLRNQIDSLTRDPQRKKSEYLRRSIPLINRYEQLGKYNNGVIFGQEDSLNFENHQERIRIIDSYLNIARNYISIDVLREPITNHNCVICGHNVSKVIPNEDGFQECNNCGYERRFYNNGVLGEIEKVTNSNSEYEDIKNFMKAITRFQGKQKFNYTKELVAKLDKYFLSISKPPGDVIKTMPADARGRRGNTDIKMLLKALQEIGERDLYEDAILISHLYWDNARPDIEQYVDKMLDHYKKTQRVLVALPSKRTSSLGTQFRLYKHLQLVGYYCHASDFKIASIRDSEEHHRTMWKLVCEKCDDPEIYYIEDN